MRLGGLIAGCALAVGCDKLLSLSPPHAPTRYTVDYTLRTIAGSTGGVTTTDALYDPVAFVVRMQDGSIPVIVHSAPGTFEFVAEPQPYEIELVRAQDEYTSRFQHDATALHLVETHVGRMDVVHPTDVVLVDFTKIPTGAGAFVWALYSTGVFAYQGLQTIPYFRNSTPVDWATTNAGLVDHREGDRLYYAEYLLDTTLSPPWSHVSASTEFDMLTMQQGSGAVNQLGSAAPTPVALRQATAVAHLGTDSARVMATLPATAANLNHTLAVVATVGDAESAPRGMPLAFAEPGPNDTNQVIQFGNPIEGTAAALVTSFTWERAVTAPGAIFSYTFKLVWLEVAPPFAATGSAGEIAQVGTGAVGVIASPTLAGTPLDSDGAAIELDLTTNPVLEWTVPSGSFDTYTVLLYELANTNLATSPVYVDNISSVVPRVTIPSDELKPGHMYGVAIYAVLGVPDAGQGDFRARAFPGGLEVFAAGTFVPALPKPPS